MNRKEIFNKAFKSSYRIGLLYRPLGVVYLMVSSHFFIQAFYLGEIWPELNWQTLAMATEQFTASNWIFIFFLFLQSLFHFAGKKQPSTLMYFSEMSLVVNNLIVLNFYFQSATLETNYILLAICPIIIFIPFNRFSQFLYQQNNKIKSPSSPLIIHALSPNFKIKENLKDHKNQKAG